MDADKKIKKTNKWGRGVTTAPENLLFRLRVGLTLISQRSGLWINKPDAVCRRYLAPSLSTPSAAIANFFLAALAGGEREADIELRCHYICVETNYISFFQSVGKWKSLPDFALCRLERKGWIIFPRSLVSYRADDCQSRERWNRNKSVGFFYVCLWGRGWFII